jgi:O-antigen/teichoic acid export membrane protein
MDPKDQLKRGTFWLGSATIAARLVDAGATLAIVGLLTQEQMGLGALALSAAAILESLSGIGMGGALVQASNVSREEESSLFWITSAIGLGLGLLLVALAPVLAATYEQPELLFLLAASGLKMLLIGISIVPLQLLSKHLQFKQIATVQTLASLGEGLSKLVLALAGAGAWALIVGNLMRGVVLLLALAALSTFRPQFHFAFGETRRFLRFGLNLAGSSALFQIYKNADYFLVGKLLGIDALGLYRVAFDVAMQPTDAIIGLVARVGFPVYSRLATNLQSLRSTFLANTRSLFLMVVPIATFIFFAGGDVLQLVGRERWAGAVPALQILVWAGLMRAATIMFSQLYIALGRPQYATFESASTLVVLTGSFWLGLKWFPELGVLSVCLAWLIVYPLFVVAHLLLLRRLISLPPLQYLRAVASGLGPGPAMLSGLYLSQHWLTGAESWLRLGIFALVALTIYVAYLRWVLRLRWRELVPRQSRSSSRGDP